MRLETCALYILMRLHDEFVPPTPHFGYLANDSKTAKMQQCRDHETKCLCKGARQGLQQNDGYVNRTVQVLMPWVLTIDDLG